MAYITRIVHGRQELLVFRHRDFPEAGVQVPAGTVKEGEPVEVALLREVAEETGLNGLQVGARLGVYDCEVPGGEIVERHVFHLTAPGGLPDDWEWLETGGGEKPDDEGYVFRYYWVDLAGEIDLAGGQGGYLTRLVAKCRR